MVNVVEELGAEALLHASLTDGAGSSQNLVVRVSPKGAPTKGAAINAAPTPGPMLYFDPVSGARIGPA